jgi:cytochrome P450
MYLLNQMDLYYVTELQLLAICIDLFMAGSDTTNKSLSFAFLHFMRQPQVVVKIQEELDRVIGRERMPTIADRPK